MQPSPDVKIRKPLPKNHPANRAPEPAFAVGGWGWLCILVLSASAFFYLLRAGSPYAFEFDPDARVAREASWAFEDCLYVFQEIGELLEQGLEPDASLRCPNTVVDNVITRSGSNVRVAHPNPAAFGMRELYVTSSDHVPVVVP